jgi:hypothetical protein
MESISVGILITYALFAIATAFVADRRGGWPLVWFLFGVLLGPLAFAVSLTAGKKCSHCLAWIPREAKVCRECTRGQ